MKEKTHDTFFRDSRYTQSPPEKRLPFIKTVLSIVRYSKKTDVSQTPFRPGCASVKGTGEIGAPLASASAFPSGTTSFS